VLCSDWLLVNEGRRFI